MDSKSPGTPPLILFLSTGLQIQGVMAFCLMPPTVCRPLSLLQSPAPAF